MLALLQKLFSFIFGHAVVDAIGDTVKNRGQKVAEDAMNRLTRNDHLLGVIFARIGTRTKELTEEQVAEGLRKFNEFYASLDGREPRDLFERLFYRDVLNAIQEYLKSRQQKTENKDKEGKVTSVTYTAPEDQQKMLQQYLALVGLAGPDEIRLEMERLDQMSGATRVKNLARKGGEGANEFFEGFRKGWKGDRR